MWPSSKDSFVDLHIHTIFSDGLLTPEEVVKKAKELGFSAIAVTDHDSVDGIERAKSIGKRLGVEVIPGVELSSFIEGTDLHILGYYIDYKNSAVLDFFARLRQSRLERAEKMVNRLAELGVKISFNRVREIAGVGVIGRPHLAQAMVEARAVSSISEAFARYIGYDGPAYLPKMRLTPLEVISFIHKYGGVAVLAHPGTYGNDSLVYTVISAGIDGIEVWHPEHNQRTVEYYREVAEKNRLLITGGSDCHGGVKFGRVYLGDVRLSYHYLTLLKRKANKR